MTETNRKKSNSSGAITIGTTLYQKKSKVMTFLLLYGILAGIGLGMILFSFSRDRNPSGVEGFTIIFGAGMAFLTWYKSRKPRIVIGEEFLDVRQQRNPELVMYKNVQTVTRTRDHRLVIGIRDGHGLKHAVVILKDLEDADADRLADFCLRKGWKKFR